MAIKRWIKTCRWVAGSLILYGIIFSYLGVLFIAILYIDYPLVFFISVLIGIGIILSGMILIIVSSILRRKHAGKRILEFRKDPIVGVIGVGLGAVGSIIMLIGEFIYIYDRPFYPPNIIWPVLGIFGATISFLGERELSGYFLVNASLCEFLIVFLLFGAWLYSGWVIEFVLILSGGILTFIGGVLVLLGEFLQVRKRIGLIGKGLNKNK